MKQLFVLIKEQCSYAFTTKKVLLFLLLYAGAFIGSMWIFFEIQKTITEGFRSQNIGTFQQEFMTGFAMSILEGKAGNTPLLDFLLHVPVVHVILFLVTIFGTPLLILLLGYDKISQEIYDGTIRYMVFRTSRGKIFLSKFLSGLLEIAFVTGLVTLFILFWASFQIPDFQWMRSLGYGLHYWIISLVFLAPFVAYSLMCSAFFRKPFLALVTSFVGWIVMVVLTFLVDYVSPYDGQYMQGLFYYFSPELLYACLVYTIFSLLFLGVGYVVFTKRDL